MNEYVRSIPVDLVADVIRAVRAELHLHRLVVCDTSSDDGESFDEDKSDSNASFSDSEEPYEDGSVDSDASFSDSEESYEDE